MLYRYDPIPNAHGWHDLIFSSVSMCEWLDTMSCVAKQLWSHGGRLHKIDIPSMSTTCLEDLVAWRVQLYLADQNAPQIVHMCISSGRNGLGESKIIAIFHPMWDWLHLCGHSADSQLHCMPIVTVQSQLWRQESHVSSFSDHLLEITVNCCLCSHLRSPVAIKLSNRVMMATTSMLWTGMCD